MAKKSLYPKSITQPNKNKSSGLAGTCFKEVRRNGKTYKVNCRDQKDPKYHHQWINTTNLKKGKTAQCGKASKYHCSHKTYYGIKGYRNTCPIAGVTGTYTQPAALRMSFDVSSIDSSAKVNSVTVKLKHRCVGVDVANSKTTVSWGPNFSGFKHYPKRKVLKMKFVDKNGKAISEVVYQDTNGKDFENPPLSTQYTEIKAKFKKVSYSDLKNGFLEIQYGNNLSTNPGNIYIKGLSITVDYDPKVPYIEGTANKKTLITSSDSCATTIQYTLTAGYKAGKTKTPDSSLQSKIQVSSKPSGTQVTKKSNGVFILKDTSGTAKKKTVTFKINGTKNTISFDYTAKTPSKPTFQIPSIFEHNVYQENIPIIAKNGCANNIKIYDNAVKPDNLIFEIKNEDEQTCINNSNQENIIEKNCGAALYKTIAQLNCGFHDLFIQVNNEEPKLAFSQKIRIDTPPHKFKYLLDDKETNTISQTSLEKSATIIYETERNYIENKFPKFNIFSSKNTDPVVLDTSTENQITVPINTSKPGPYFIRIIGKENVCEEKEYDNFSYEVVSDHEQHYDKIYIKTEETDMDCEYLVVWEGDRNKAPIYINSFELNNSFNDIRVCSKETNQTGLIGVDYFPLTIKNTGNKNINNLFIELNVLVDNNGEYEPTTDEWIELEGMFYNFKNNFEEYNSNLENLVSVMNLTKDNDFIDEEDVYIKINEIKAGKALNLKIPYGSKIEKEVLVQILLFETKMQIYPENCTGETFSEIKLITYDSILTDLNISGENNLAEIICDGNNGSYFETDITYTAENIDTSSLTKPASLLIDNDPRLTPVSVIQQDGSSLEINNGASKIEYTEKGTAIKKTALIGRKVYAQFSFLNNVVYNFETVTDDSGRAVFYVTIPEWTDTTYSIEDIINNAVIKYEGSFDYPKAELINGINSSVDTTFRYLPDSNGYIKNEMIVVTVILETNLKFIQNQIKFTADIINPGDKDEVTIKYRIYNLKDYHGILTTSLKTNEVGLIPNEVNKDIYCRINTNLIARSHLMKKIVEEREINTLQVSLLNLERDNKDIVIKIGEISSPKYDLLNTNIDIGQIQIKEIENSDSYNIFWQIDYMEKNDTAIGIFDFVAKDLTPGSDGLSTIEIIVTDFLSDNLYAEIEGDYCCQGE